MKKAIITGVTGQDGSYLATHLLKLGYEVTGVARRASTDNTERVANIASEHFEIVEGDITDAHFVAGVLSEKPDEYYNLAAQSHVGASFTQPAYTMDVNVTGVLNALESIRLLSPSTKFYQASTSELFGDNFTFSPDNISPLVTQKATTVIGKNLLQNQPDRCWQDEDTPFDPRSPYAVSKLAAHKLVKNYRDSYGLYASCGILFNHESPRRGEKFVTRKITKWIAEFSKWNYPLFEQGQLAEQDNKNRLYNSICDRVGFPKLRLGNIDAYRDWGYAKDYVEVMHKMLQQKNPEDYVVCTGETNSVRTFLKEAFSYIGVDNYEDYIVIDPKFYRPAEVDYLKGSYNKAKTEIGWNPRTSFKELVKLMVESDIG